MSSSDVLKKTPLYDQHLALGGKMVNFAGWQMPIYYSSIISEHQWTRSKASIFDVSHLGEFHVSGSGAFKFLQYCLTNDLSKLSDKKILYSVLCDENGFALDDVLVYQEKADDFYLIVNAANIDSDFKALLRHCPDTVSLKDHSDQTSCIAVQGPKSEEILQKLFGFKLSNLNYYFFKEEKFNQEALWISRSGYTGEDGFEIFSSNALVVALWEKLIHEGGVMGIAPAGLGARNTLRLEAGNALYGNDLDRTTTPLEARLGFAVSFTKGDFVGRAALWKQKQEGVQKSLVAFKVLDKPIAREHYLIFKNNKPVGSVTSGSFGPSVGCNIGLGYIEKQFANFGEVIQIQIHGQLVNAEIVKLPFVEKKHKERLL